MAVFWNLRKVFILWLHTQSMLSSPVHFRVISFDIYYIKSMKVCGSFQMFHCCIYYIAWNKILWRKLRFIKFNLSATKLKVMALTRTLHFRPRISLWCTWSTSYILNSLKLSTVPEVIVWMLYTSEYLYFSLNNIC